jgi:hypothetical protein
MDSLDLFFKKYSYKFDKGYPDMNNNQDVLLLESLLSELGFTLNEADTSEATLFESALVKAWYNLNKKIMPKNAISVEDDTKLKTNPKMVSKAEAIIKDLNLQGGDSARQTGRGVGNTTAFWQSFGATDKTPKTDVILGDKKISVKVGPSQLMSGGKAESTATFYSAMQNTPDDPDEPKLLDTPEAKAVIDTFDKFIKTGITQADKVSKELSKGTNQILDSADKAHKEMRSKLQDLFNKSKKFKVAFAREAMSGYKKFGPNSEASADWVLSADKSLNKGSIHSVNDDLYVAKIADQMNMTVRFKSTSEKIKGEKTGKYRFWSVVSLLINPTTIDALSSLTEEDKQLNENIFTDTVDKIKNIFQTGIEKIVKFIAPDKEDIDVDINNNINF